MLPLKYTSNEKLSIAPHTNTSLGILFRIQISLINMKPMENQKNEFKTKVIKEKFLFSYGHDFLLLSVCGVGVGHLMS